MYFEVKPGTKPSTQDIINDIKDRPLHENYSVPNGDDSRNREKPKDNNNKK